MSLRTWHWGRSKSNCPVASLHRYSYLLFIILPMTHWHSILVVLVITSTPASAGKGSHACLYAQLLDVSYMQLKLSNVAIEPIIRKYTLKVTVLMHSTYNHIWLGIMKGQFNNCFSLNSTLSGQLKFKCCYYDLLIFKWLTWLIVLLIPYNLSALLISWILVNPYKKTEFGNIQHTESLSI